MSHSNICCGLYRGTLAIRNRGVAGSSFQSIGNAEFTVNHEITDIEQPNYESLGGTACKVSYINSATMDATLYCMSPENIATAVLGTLTNIEANEVTDEKHEVWSIDAYIPFNNVPDKAESIVVKNESGLTTYDLDKDYILTSSGIKIIEGSTIAVDGSEISVSYVYGNNFQIDALTLSQQEFEVLFDGVNVGEAGEVPVVIRFWKVKFSPAESIAIISGEDFANLPLSGEILSDSSKSTGSKFYKITFGQSSNGAY